LIFSSKKPKRFSEFRKKQNRLGARGGLKAVFFWTKFERFLTQIPKTDLVIKSSIL